MNTHLPTLLVLLTLGMPVAYGCGACRATTLPAPDPVIVSVTGRDAAQPVAVANGAAAAALITAVAGRWDASLPLPRCAPSHVLIDSQDRRYQILAGGILAGPDGAVRDPELVRNLLAALGTGA